MDLDRSCIRVLLHLNLRSEVRVLLSLAATRICNPELYYELRYVP